ncbi:DUF1697 domain-containing protein [Halomonas sp. HNIBRBA4712]|uniref:DUF1697 domain-containing protein n=1 Tax=Halomonas sp. HNIBRBA4712 TaxID=3373087 RepID=UPI003745A54D
MSLKVALMRSVVIDKQRVKMADARALVERVGGRDVQSVIATGNLLFHSDKSNEALEAQLEAECAAFYGQPTHMVVRTAREWQILMEANPFVEEAADLPSRLLVWIMREPLPDAGLEQLRQRAVQGEKIERTANGDFYVWFGQTPIDQSKVPAGFGLKALGAIGTNRNWNTVARIADIFQTMR